jgi:hypothetical protein
MRIVDNNVLSSGPAIKIAVIQPGDIPKNESVTHHDH